MSKLLTFFLAILFSCYSLKAQDTVAIKNQHFKPTSFIIPAVFIGYGLVSLTGDNAIRRLDYTTNNELREDHPNFAMKIDNYSRYIPAVAVYGLDLIGIKAKNNVVDRSIMLATSYAITSAITGTMKVTSNRLRPNGTDRHSFPSGHTALAFMTAEFLHQEYKDQSAWYGVAGYAIATGTGVLRLYNNAHWVSDVVAGAGVGILSTKLSYLIYPYLKRKFAHKKSAPMMFTPTYQSGSMGFNLIKSF
uniref:phosphatase PAP2 family protein n=1 Tax=Pedobacter schmidteae TaxID=2201271 RepID=UPI000EACAF8F|nr:phosphatase PAP2 family protein [Pedobacter schmidteae]